MDLGPPRIPRPRPLCPPPSARTTKIKSNLLDVVHALAAGLAAFDEARACLLEVPRRADVASSSEAR